MNDPIAFLAAHAGRYEGAGISHDGRGFVGVLIIEPPLNPSTLSYRFIATASDGETLHTEIASIGRSRAGAIEIVHVSNNIPGLQHFRLGDSGDGEMVLIHGDLADPQVFREIVRLLFSSETTGRLSYEWAMPGEAMAPRSRVDLTMTSI
ncbi:hypothetical protein [Acidiphilium acidophilum]|uniref:hypothetical protein n=1 Tax=Acidiphilium acidophilum TaxID=76588 RepID=UPI002E8E722E|nr:hypothetical protein [Acidiphilium acidophilum]